MGMSPRDWTDMATVFRAGAAECYRSDDAKAYEAMAARCEAIAVERNNEAPLP